MFLLYPPSTLILFNAFIKQRLAQLETAESLMTILETEKASLNCHSLQKLLPNRPRFGPFASAHALIAPPIELSPESSALLLIREGKDRIIAQSAPIANIKLQESAA
jgi:hypothetical protein